MDNLDEILIIKNEKGMQYVNKKGFEIIDNIQFTNFEKKINDPSKDEEL